MKKQPDYQEPEFLPQINGGFWYGIAKELSSNLPEKIDSMSERLEKFILWLWGVYTPIIGIGSTGLVLLGKTLPVWYASIVILAPCISLIFAYYYIVRAREVVVDKYNPDSPEKIKEFYDNICVQKRKNYSIAHKITTFTCAILIPFGLLLANVKNNPNSIEFYSEVTTSKDNKKLVTLYVSGDFEVKDVNKKLLIKLLDENQKPIEGIEIRYLQHPSKSHIVHTTYDIATESKKLFSVLEWNESAEYKHIITKEVTLSK